MKRFNILYGKEIPINDKINNSFFLYHTIFLSKANEKNKLISFYSNKLYSAILFLVEQDFLILEIYQNIINEKTQEINFILKNKIKLALLSLEYDYTSDEDIQMFFLCDKYIIIENILKRSIILDIEKGNFTTIILKGKKSQKKNINYNHGQDSGDDLFKDSSLDSDKDNKNYLSNINEKNSNTNNLFNNNQIKNDNDSKASSNFSGDNLGNKDSSFINENYNTLKILYVFDEYYQIIVDTQNKNNTSNNLIKIATIPNIDNPNTSNNNINIDTNTNTNININNTNMTPLINPSPINISNNSFILSKKYNPNMNRILNQNNNNITSTNNNTNYIENLESITSNDISINRGNETKKNINITNNFNYTTLNTNIMTTLPSSNQNTIDDIKIVFNNNKQNRYKKITLKRSYIFMTDKNQIYYCIIGDNYDLNQILEFKPVAFDLDENELIDEMKIIKIYKDDRTSFIFFLLSKSSLIIIPSDFCRSTLKNIILYNSYNREKSFKLCYKLNYIQDPLNHYHMVINYKYPQNSNVYILNNNSLISIDLNLMNLRNFIKEQVYNVYSINNTNYDLVEEKIQCENGIIAILNKKKKIIYFDKQSYSVKDIKISGYITCLDYKDDNLIIYDKVSKSLAIYYFNGKYLDKVENHKDVDLIFFFSLPKIYSSFFCMNNTINKISFNKKLYWYSQYFDIHLINIKKKGFEFFGLKNHIEEIKEKYINGIFQQSDKEIIKKTKSSKKLKITKIKKHCEFCRKEIMVNLNIIENKINESDNETYFKCLNEKCQAIYCCEQHREIDYKSFHFFHCKLKHFFLSYKFSNQINFFNDFILSLNAIIKYIFNNVKETDDYLFFLPFIKVIIFILKRFNMKSLSDTVIDFSQRINISKDEYLSLLFYQEVIFYYYNLILLSLNFGQRCNLLDFIWKEIEYIQDEDEQFFCKTNLKMNLFSRNIHFYQDFIDLSEYHFFFLDENYLNKSIYLRQNDILFSHVIHLYANYLHLTDKLCKENQLNIIYLNPFNIKLLSQLFMFFEGRNKDVPDDTYIHFLSLIAPHFTLNRKMILVEKILSKANELLEREVYIDSIFRVEINHNLGLIKYSMGSFLQGIHNIEQGYNQIIEKDYSYLLRIKLVERLALAYLNIAELLKSFVLIKEALNLRTNLKQLYEYNTNIYLHKNNIINKNDYLYQQYYLLANNISGKKIDYNNIYNKKFKENNINIINKRLGFFENNDAYYENEIRMVHLFSYINYIQDFIEYENQLKLLKDKGKKNNLMSKREYQLYLINYVLSKDDLVTKNKNFNIIDTYCEEYFRAIEFLYSLKKDILTTIENDNQTKKTTLMLNETINQNSNNNNHNIINIYSPNSNLEENKRRKSESVIIYNNNNQNNELNENEKYFECDDEIEIKEDLFDILSRKEQLILTSINTKFFNRKNLLRDYYGSINKNNINYHPIYTKEFKEIILNSKHQFFVKKLTQANSPELTSYFFPTSNNNLEGLSKYIQQEEIQNMYKIEKAKILAVLKNDINLNKKNIKNPELIMRKEQEEVDINIQKKEEWITNIKAHLLKNKNHSLPEIDIALSNLYDNLNSEYKDEIIKNPELILYYIFIEISSPNGYTNAIELKKKSLEDNTDVYTKEHKIYYQNLKENKKMDNKQPSFSDNSNEDNNDDNDEENSKSERKLNLYELVGIPEERRLTFSDNSSSNDDIELNNINNFNFDFANNIDNDNEMKDFNKNKFEDVKEISEEKEEI